VTETPLFTNNDIYFYCHSVYPLCLVFIRYYGNCSGYRGPHTSRGQHVA